MCLIDSQVHESHFTSEQTIRHDIFYNAGQSPQAIAVKAEKTHINSNTV